MCGSEDTEIYGHWTLANKGSRSIGSKAMRDLDPRTLKKY